MHDFFSSVEIQKAELLFGHSVQESESFLSVSLQKFNKAPQKYGKCDSWE